MAKCEMSDLALFTAFAEFFKKCQKDDHTIHKQYEPIDLNSRGSNDVITLLQRAFGYIFIQTCKVYELN